MVPDSTVASKSAFSTEWCILNLFCSSLSPKMVQSLICAQNWLQSSVPISQRKAMDNVEKFEEYEQFSYWAMQPKLGCAVGSAWDPVELAIPC